MVEETEVKTMWSETLLESLYVAMEKEKGDKIVVGIIKDLKAKGYENEYLIDKVQKKIGPSAAQRLTVLLGSGVKAANPQQSAQIRNGKVKPKQGEGLVDKILGIFK